MEAHIPNSMKKYYEVSDINIFVESGVASSEEAFQVNQYAELLLQSTDRKLLGWAIAKEEYQEKLSEAELGFVCIASKNSRTQLIAIFGENLVIISESKLQKYL